MDFLFLAETPFAAITESVVLWPLEPFLIEQGADGRGERVAGEVLTSQQASAPSRERERELDNKEDGSKQGISS